MTEFVNLLSALDAPRRQQCPPSFPPRHLGDRLLHYTLWRPDRRRYGTFRPRQTGIPAILKLENGIPSHDTFSRLPGMLDHAAFQQWFTGFMWQFAAGGGGVLAVDGKTLRRSYNHAEQRSPLHPVSTRAEE